MTVIDLLQRKRTTRLTDNQALVLLTIGERLLRLTDIAERCKMSPSSVSKVVHDLKYRVPVALIEDDRPMVKLGKCEPAFFWLTDEGFRMVAKLLGK